MLSKDYLFSILSKVYKNWFQTFLSKRTVSEPNEIRKITMRVNEIVGKDCIEKALKMENVLYSRSLFVLERDRKFLVVFECLFHVLKLRSPICKHHCALVKFSISRSYPLRGKCSTETAMTGAPVTADCVNQCFRRFDSRDKNRTETRRFVKLIYFLRSRSSIKCVRGTGKVWVTSRLRDTIEKKYDIDLPQCINASIVCCPSKLGVL